MASSLPRVSTQRMTRAELNLALPGCRNKTPQTGRLINNRNLFLTDWRPKSRVMALAELVFVRAYWCMECPLYGMSSLGGRGKTRLWGFFRKGINPTHEGSTF